MEQLSIIMKYLHSIMNEFKNRKITKIWNGSFGLMIES